MMWEVKNEQQILDDIRAGMEMLTIEIEMPERPDPAPMLPTAVLCITVPKERERKFVNAQPHRICSPRGAK